MALMCNNNRSFASDSSSLKAPSALKANSRQPRLSSGTFDSVGANPSSHLRNPVKTYGKKPVILKEVSSSQQKKFCNQYFHQEVEYNAENCADVSFHHSKDSILKDATLSEEDCNGSQSDFKVGNSILKFFNCNVTINIVTDK